MGGLAQDIGITYMNGLFFGIYFISVCFTNRWLLFTPEGWKLKTRIQWMMLIVTNLIAALILVDAVIVVLVPMAQMTFVDEGNKPTAWRDPAWNSILKCMIANTVALLADTVLMYRLWVTHGRNFVVMWFPISLWVGGIVCTILQLYLQIVHIHNPNFGPYHWAAVNMSVGPGIALTPFWASTIALNAYCTGRLSWRIWVASKKGENSTISRRLRFLVRILMESGTLYLTISLAHFFAWFGHDNDFAIHLLGSMNTIVIGIAFNLVLIRTAQNKAGIEGTSASGGTQTAVNCTPPPIISVHVHSMVDTATSSTEYGDINSRGILDTDEKHLQTMSTA